VIYGGVEPMNELISPSQSENLVLVVAVALAIVGGAWSLKFHGARAAILIVVAASSLWPLWKLHNWLTRSDRQSGSFGLESVKVLLVEVALFVVLGALFGWSWKRITAENAEDAEKKERGEAKEEAKVL